MINRVVLVTGGFDPIHSGHIAYFKAAKALGHLLVVGVNSDAWVARKKGRAFMPSTERIDIIENLKMVDHCILFNDDDDTAIEAINNVKRMYPLSEIVFANGGDRTKNNIPELNCTGISFAFDVGGKNKLNSSSWILDEWKAPKTRREWGYYRVIHEIPGLKVKEITVDPGKHLSMQKHQDRAELWFVAVGEATVSEYSRVYPTAIQTPHLPTHSTHRIPKQQWHQLSNPYSTPCRIIEIQYGDACNEDDIERRE
jgi:cytidyltransferase-like protein